MTVKPIGNRVLLRIAKKEEKSSGGIYIPATAQEKTQEGLVIAVGDATDEIKVNVGDRVMYDKYAGSQIKLDDEDHLIAKMEDIIAILS